MKLDKQITMPKVMKMITVIGILVTLVTMIIYQNNNSSIFLTLAITFGTITYHFGMRLLIGWLVMILMKNKADYTKQWYQLHSWEKAFYKKIKIKRWKNKMPTYRPQDFSPKEHSWHEIAQTMCQSEVGHELIIGFSFLPIIASKWFGAFVVFVITSVISAGFDLIFVMMQRYNRDRIQRLIR